MRDRLHRRDHRCRRYSNGSASPGIGARNFTPYSAWCPRFGECVFDLDIASVKVSNSKIFAEMPKPGITDGLRTDSAGRVWCSVGWGDPNEDGVRCYTPEGDLLGKIHIPETVANLCFGGQQRNRLYICGSTSLYAVYTSVQSAMKP